MTKRQFIKNVMEPTLLALREGVPAKKVLSLALPEVYDAGFRTGAVRGIKTVKGTVSK